MEKAVEWSERERGRREGCIKKSSSNAPLAAIQLTNRHKWRHSQQGVAPSPCRCPCCCYSFSGCFPILPHTPLLTHSQRNTERGKQPTMTTDFSPCYVMLKFGNAAFVACTHHSTNVNYSKTRVCVPVCVCACACVCVLVCCCCCDLFRDVAIGSNKTHTDTSTHSNSIFYSNFECERAQARERERAPAANSPQESANTRAQAYALSVCVCVCADFDSKQKSAENFISAPLFVMLALQLCA